MGKIEKGVTKVEIKMISIFHVEGKKRSNVKQGTLFPI